MKLERDTSKEYLPIPVPSIEGKNLPTRYVEGRQYSLEDMEHILTVKEFLFCRYYVRHWNKSESVLRAGYDYSDRGDANRYGCELLRRPHIRYTINLLKVDIELNLGISKTAVIEEHWKRATASLGDIHNTWTDLKDYESLPPEVKSSIKAIEHKVTRRMVRDSDGEPRLEETTMVKLEMHDSHKHLVEISKMMGYYEAEKTININANIDYRELSNEELRRRAEDIKTLHIEANDK